MDLQTVIGTLNRIDADPKDLVGFLHPVSWRVLRAEVMGWCVANKRPMFAAEIPRVNFLVRRMPVILRADQNPGEIEIMTCAAARVPRWSRVMAIMQEATNEFRD